MLTNFCGVNAPTVTDACCEAADLPDWTDLGESPRSSGLWGAPTARMPQCTEPRAERAVTDGKVMETVKFWMLVTFVFNMVQQQVIYLIFFIIVIFDKWISKFQQIRQSCKRAQAGSFQGTVSSLLLWTEGRAVSRFSHGCRWLRKSHHVSCRFCSELWDPTSSQFLRTKGNGLSRPDVSGWGGMVYPE